MKRQTKEWEKTFAIDVTNNRLVSKIYKQLLRLSIKKTNHLIKKQSEDLNRCLSKEDYRWPKETHEKMLNIANY